MPRVPAVFSKAGSRRSKTWNNNPRDKVQLSSRRYCSGEFNWILVRRETGHSFAGAPDPRLILDSIYKQMARDGKGKNALTRKPLDFPHT
jgi:hypothetical protein